MSPLYNPGGGAPSGAAGGDLAGTYPNPDIGTGVVVGGDLADLTVTGRKLSDLARTGGWLPTNAIDQTVADRVGLAATATLTSGTLFVAGGCVIPGGRAVSSITFFSGNTGATTPTAQWFALYDALTLALLATTVDDGATAWSSAAAKTLLIATTLRGATPGGTYTPAAGKEVYLGICVNATTPPNLRGITGNAGVLGVAPAIVGSSSAGLAAGVANAPDPAGAVTSSTTVPWAYIL